MGTNGAALVGFDNLIDAVYENQLAARLAELQAAWNEQKRRSGESIKTPKTDYAAIVEGLRALAPKSESKA